MGTFKRCVALCRPRESTVKRDGMSGIDSTLPASGTKDDDDCGCRKIPLQRPLTPGQGSFFTLATIPSRMQRQIKQLRNHSPEAVLVHI